MLVNLLTDEEGTRHNRNMILRKVAILNIRKRELKFLGHIMRKDGLGNLTHSEHIEGNREREK